MRICACAPGTIAISRVAAIAGGAGTAGMRGGAGGHGAEDPLDLGDAPRRS